MAHFTPIGETFLAKNSLNSSQKNWLAQTANHYGTPSLILDLDSVRMQYRALTRALPNVTLHYALKPLPHAEVVKVLAQEGANFDLATNGEVDLVHQLEIDPSRTIHTHPIKKPADIQRALDYGCRVFVVDNLNELKKMIEFRHQVMILIRLSFKNPDVSADLSKKFGCSPQMAIDIAKQAYQWGITVQGLSFHVGSQTCDPLKYVHAIDVCAAVMEQIIAQGLPALTTLDIGGGFPVAYSDKVPNIDEFCQPINLAIAKLPQNVTVIAEPGRFIVAPCMTALTAVIGKAQRDNQTWYYLDDGLYGSFSGLVFDEARYPIQALKESEQRFSSVLAGPTCDSIDVIHDNIMLPELDEGDILVTKMMGAYTSATATDFNFIRRANIIVVEQPALLSMAG
ncbi:MULTISPECIES: type III PLP-dependent enzyme [unclassified Vibrio]|uniref:Type III PLP-dependent enzyme n=1 Tax=Vibrio sp. HB236076 TaxID=3232307 RepID=A0AB39HJI6_9VIBR|nr:type III PLP-dependent enzyme [Vibrio sp. HB161653]MDP5252685.1 type III PLP-dependent enzyme [Vibrio sp. HB161653]